MPAYHAMVGWFLRVSFQRYPSPADGDTGPEPPRSWGALPIVLRAPGACLVPLAANEALWLGLSPARQSLIVAVTIAAPGSTPLQVEVPPIQALDLISTATGLRPLTRANLGMRAMLGLTAVPARRTTASEPARDRLRPLHSPSPSGAKEPLLARGSWHFDRRTELKVEFVEPEIFTAETGQPAPPPLDPSTVYRGWYLP
jgi:hypothetical protein